MSVSLIYIRRSTPLTILRLPKPISEFTYVTAFSSFASTIDGWVLTPESTNYVIKVLWSCCDTIAIGDTSYRYELIRSQLSTNRFVSPRASESALSYTHRVCIGLMIAANDWTLNLTTLYWSQIYSILQLSSSATTLISVRNTRVFRTALTALTEPRTLWRRITRCPSPSRRVVLHMYSFTLWWRLRTIRRTRVLHSSQGLQLCWSRFPNAWRC